MKNKKLIKELSKLNPEAEVSTPFSDDITINYIKENGTDEKNTPLILIEPKDYILL